jgi:hypothetical protein
VWGEGVGGGIGAVLMGGRRGGEALIGAPARLVLDLGLCRVKGHYGSGLLFQVGGAFLASFWDRGFCLLGLRLACLWPSVRLILPPA